MALYEMIKKNFKLLYRSKSSAFIVLLGPFLIIALVGAIFSGKSGYDLSVGYHDPSGSPLAASYIESLKNSSYIVREYSSEQDCERKIMEGVIHTCIIFPMNFELANDVTQQVRFLVDESRINLVYAVIDSISAIIESESREVSYSLTGTVLDRLDETSVFLGGSSDTAAALKGRHKSAIQKTSSAIESVGKLDFDVPSIDLALFRDHVEVLNASLESMREQGLELIAMSERMLEQLSDYINSTDRDAYRERLDNMSLSLQNSQNASPAQLSMIVDDADFISSALEQVKAQALANSKLSEQTSSGLQESIAEIEEAVVAVEEFESDVARLRDSISSVNIKSASTIVNPVGTKIEPVLSQSSKLQFTLPLLVMLIIMFEALLLASTMVIYEKLSKASFRNFMMPVSRRWHDSSFFITVTLIIFVQVVIILAIMQVLLRLDTVGNFVSTVLILLVSIMLFTILGMLIGKLLSKQEGAVMTSLVFGSVFIFVSNLVIPLETLAPAFSAMIGFNPYVAFSEALRRSMLFKLDFFASLSGASIWIAVVIFGLVVVLSEGLHFKLKYSKRAFKLGRLMVYDPESLLKALRKVSDHEFVRRRPKLLLWAKLTDKDLLGLLEPCHTRRQALDVVEEFCRPKIRS